MLFVLAGGGRAQAQIGSDRYASMVIDVQSGQVLSSANPDEYRFPASLTKMMTIYIAFEALRNRQISWSEMVPVSSSAASMPPTKLGLVPGTSLTVEQALLGLVTKSANDAAAALGELLAGDEDRFSQLMTVRAHALGMTHTTFRNASGLPDWGQVTTAHDLVVLARHLIQDFPEYYQLFSTPYFQFHGRTVFNHQGLLRTYPGADGLKTGYTEASGYNVVASAVRGNTRLLGVVLGAASGRERDLHMAALLDQGFLRLGVSPVEVSRREPPFGMPLIGSARAAPAPAYPVVIEETVRRPGRWRAAEPVRVVRAVPVRRWSPIPLAPMPVVPAWARHTGRSMPIPPAPAARAASNRNRLPPHS